MRVLAIASRNAANLLHLTPYRCRRGRLATHQAIHTCAETDRRAAGMAEWSGRFRLRVAGVAAQCLGASESRSGVPRGCDLAARAGVSGGASAPEVRHDVRAGAAAADDVTSATSADAHRLVARDPEILGERATRRQARVRRPSLMIAARRRSQIPLTVILLRLQTVTSTRIRPVWSSLLCTRTRQDTVELHVQSLPSLAAVRRERLFPVRARRRDLRPGKADADRLAAQRVVRIESADAVDELPSPGSTAPCGVRESTHQSHTLFGRTTQADAAVVVVWQMTLSSTSPPHHPCCTCLEVLPLVTVRHPPQAAVLHAPVADEKSKSRRPLTSGFSISVVVLRRLDRDDDADGQQRGGRREYDAESHELCS